MADRGGKSDQPIGIVVVAETRLYREGLATVIGRHTGIEIRGSASDPEDGVAHAVASNADIVLLDIAATPGPKALRAIVDALPEARVVAFGIAETEEVVIRCAEAGVAGYVPREAALEELVAVLRGVMRDEVVCSPRLTATLLRRVGALARQRDPAASTDPVRLTARETQVVALIDEGLSNKEIASRLQIELPTVKNHVHHILEKLDVNRRGEAVARVRALRRAG